MTESQRAKLLKEMEAHGYLVPIVARPAGKGVYEIIDGEQRWDELRKEGADEVDVVIKDLDDTEARIATVNLNELQGEWDEEGLGKLVSDLRGDVSLGELAERLPFTTSELHSMSVETDGLYSELVQEFVLDAQEVEPEVSRGDVLELGGHRVMCGDVTSADDVAELMDGKKAHMLFTDPPYGARYKTDKSPSGRVGAASRVRTRFPGIEGDALSAEEWEDLIRGFLQTTKPVMVNGGPYYVCIGTYYSGRLQRLLEDGDIHFSTFVVWHKERSSFGRKDYHSVYELVAYGWKKGAAHRWYGGRRQTDVWEVSRDSVRNYIHPTQKPVSLATRAIENSCREDDVVLDPFGGSGTTLIAAEHVGRRCYIMDIAPRNVDLIKARWEKFRRQIGGDT
jgi:DNA modification methylase